jgi:hypothetical protein
MDKILPFEMNPDIVSYQHHCFPLGILYSDEHNKNEWMCNNYIQLLAYINDENLCTRMDFVFTDMNKCIIFESDQISKNTLHKNNILVESLIINYLENNKYIMTSVNEFHIEGTDAFGNYNKNHQLLIYGYSDDLFYVAGYRNGLYQKYTLKREILSNLYFGDNSMFQVIITYRKKYNYNLAVCPDVIINQINDYLNSYNTALIYGNTMDQCLKNHLFGIKAVESLISVLNNNFQYIDIRNFKIFEEHKKIMHKRLEYIFDKYNIDNDEILNRYKIIHEHSLFIFNLCIKYNIDQKPDILSRIKNLIQIILNEEIKILPVIINLISYI